MLRQALLSIHSNRFTAPVASLRRFGNSAGGAEIFLGARAAYRGPGLISIHFILSYLEFSALLA
jgi:hypothetical protein